MKRSLFYIFMALVCAACTLAGCKKDEANKAPEGVFWFNEGADTEEIPGAIMYKDGIRTGERNRQARQKGKYGVYDTAWYIYYHPE